MEETSKSGFDNPFIQLLTRIGDLILLNVLFLICCVPIVTIGASAAALTKVTQDIAMDTDAGVFMPFFRAFRDNFKQATLLWLGVAVIIAALASYRLIISAFCTGSASAVLGGILFVVTAVLLGIAVYLLPLMVRYENTLREIIRNGAILAICKLPRTIAMALMVAFPLIIFALSVETFADVLVFWLLFGCAFTSYVCGLLLKPVLQELEKSPDGKTGITIMK